MKPEIISMIAAAVSAFAALVTIYLYRSQGKGFIWTKDPSVQFGFLPDKTVDMVVRIPLCNLGLGNIRFLSLRAKRIHLKNNSIENFKLDMDEAYFPPGVTIITYRTPVISSLKNANVTQTQMIKVFDPKSLDEFSAAEAENTINNAINELGEVLFVLECKYKDGGWFGFGTRTTTIAMSLKNLDLNYLSVERRKELDDLFH